MARAQVSPAAAARARRALPARLAGGALRPRRRSPLLPLPQGPGRHELVAHARLGDADRVPRPARDRRDPGDVLQAEPGQAHASVQHITDDVWGGWLVRGMHRWGASVFIILMFMHMGARLPVRRVQVPARAELDRRRAPARDGALRRAHRLPAPLRPDRLLGDGRGDQHQRDGAVRRAFPRIAVTGRRRDRARHARRFYSLHMLLVPGALMGLIGLHLYLVVRLGVSSPPWSGEAAGAPERARAAAGALGPRAAAPEDDSREADGMTLARRPPRGLPAYKEDVKARGKPFYPYAMFHDTVMSLVVVLVIVGLRRRLALHGDILGRRSSATRPTRGRRTSFRGPTGTSTSSSTCSGSSSGRRR